LKAVKPDNDTESTPQTSDEEKLAPWSKSKNHPPEKEAAEDWFEEEKRERIQAGV
jgi:hypothetical protein